MLHATTHKCTNYPLNYICRETLEVLQLEKQKLQDQCLCLEAKLIEREEKLQQQEEEYRKNDAARVQTMKELKAVASHWTEKWQQAALTLQSTQEELETLKESNHRKDVRFEKCYFPVMSTSGTVQYFKRTSVSNGLDVCGTQVNTWVMRLNTFYTGD